MKPKHYVFLFALLAAFASESAVNDIFPADFVSLPVGTTTAAFYGFSRNQSGPFQQGHKSMDGSLDSQTAAVRFTHVMNLGGLKVSPLAVLSWSNVDIQPAALKNALAPQTNGYADLRLGAAAWLIDDHDAGHFLGINGILTVPTGTYHTTQPLNIGENRYRFSFGGGWVHPFLIRDLLFEVSPEVSFYGDNNEYLGNRKLEQKTSYALTSYLRYRMTQPWHLHVGWQGNWGGRTSINGIDQNNPPGNHRWMLGSTWIVNQHNQVILRLAKDYKIENGFKLDQEIALRWMLMW